MTLHTTRPAAAIIADILTIKNPVKGTLTKTMRTLKNGSQYPHYHLQRSVKGKNITTYVPADKAENVMEGIRQQQRLTLLMEELAQAGLNAALADKADSGLEKKRTSSSKTSSPTRAKKRASSSTPSTR